MARSTCPLSAVLHTFVSGSRAFQAVHTAWSSTYRDDMVTQTTDEASLTDVEEALVDHVTRGELLDLAADEPVDEAAMRTWDSSRTIRAAVVRDILRGRLVPDPDPHGLRLRGARIAGQLDLEHLTTDVGVGLVDCLLGEGLVARDAKLPFLSLSGCRLEHPAQPPLDADRLTAAALGLDRAVITAACEAGAVGLAGAHLGTLSCDGATMRNGTGPALAADGLQVDRGVWLAGGFKAVGAGTHGAVRLLGAHVGDQLECTDATMRNESGPALDAEGIRVDRNVFLRGGFEAVGAGKNGAVRLLGAHLGGNLDCTGATMRNDTGPALNADRLRVDQNVFLHGRFEAVGAGAHGAVRLLGAHVGGQLECSDATMRNDTGSALAADGLQVHQDVFLSGGFKAVGAGNKGAVRLLGAQLRRLDCSGATMRNDSGPALDAQGLQVDQHVSLSDWFEAVGAGSGVTLDLSHVRIGGVLVFAPARLEHAADPHARLALDGLTYAGPPVGTSSPDWLRLLREATPSYAAQPYQQLAAAQRAAGHDGEARRTLMAQRRDQINRGALTGRAERAWARLTGLTLGYGYQPWRALLFLLGVATVAVILAVVLGARGGVARTDPKPPSATECSVVERVGVGLDIGLPLIKTGTRDHCDTTSSTTGQVLTVAGWVLQVLAWAFATLFVAGFTSAVRKT
jgi:hypothetical protein